MKHLLLLLMISSCASCATYVYQPEIMGVVYDFTTRQPVADADIVFIQDTLTLGATYGSGRGHVGFVVGKNSAGKIVLLGGNQSDQVKLSNFNASAIEKYVFPIGYTPSYELDIVDNTSSASFSQTR